MLERDVPADARAEVLIGARRWLRQVLDDTRTIRLHREILASPTLGPDYTAADVGIHLAATTCHDAVPAGEYLLSFELQWASEPSHVDCNVPRATLEIE